MSDQITGASKELGFADVLDILKQCETSAISARSSAEILRNKLVCPFPKEKCEGERPAPASIVRELHERLLWLKETLAETNEHLNVVKNLF